MKTQHHAGMRAVSLTGPLPSLPQIRGPAAPHFDCRWSGRHRQAPTTSAEGRIRSNNGGGGWAVAPGFRRRHGGAILEDS